MTSKIYMNTYISYILNLQDLIPQNGQAHTINFLGLFDNTMGPSF